MAKEMTEFEAFNHINSLFGNTIRTSDELEKVDIIKTTSPSLDRALGVGGWPRGRVIQLAGKPSSGKTALSLIAIAEWQRMDPENCAAFLDAEYTFDPSWAEGFGVDLDRLLLVKNNSGAELFTGLIGEMKINSATGKATKVPGLLDFVQDGTIIKAKNSKTGKIISLNCKKLGIIVLDSVASVNTPTEEVSAIGKQNMALMSRFLSVELKKLTPALSKSNVAFIAINQVRTSPGVMFGDPTTTSGGNAWKHACSLMVMLAPLTAKDAQIMDANEEQIGTRVKAKIAKNKVARPFKTAEYNLNFDKGVINKAEELLDTGVITRVFERPNNRSYIVNNEKLNSRSDAIEYINQNFDLIEGIVRESYINKTPEFSIDEHEMMEELNPLLKEHHEDEE